LLSFKFKEKVSPASYTSKLANQVHKYAPEDVLSGPYLLEEYKPELIKEFLSHLRSNNFRMLLVTDLFPADEWEKAAHYGTEYIQMPLPEELANVKLTIRE
jgi:insulysin